MGRVVERAANPKEIREEQLGYEEFAPTRIEPAEYDHGDRNADDEQGA